MNTPLVSVILPLYNEPMEFARDAINSILMQTFTDYELILIIDNPANRELINLVHEYENADERVSIIINERNLGLPSTLNRGIDASKGRYIARMDGDDVSAPSRFEIQVNYLEAHPEIDLIGCNATIIDENSNVIGHYNKFSSDFAQKIMLRHVGSNLIHPTWMGKATIFRQLKYRDFWYCENYDFLLRASAENFHFHNLKKDLLSYRIVQRSLRSISREKAYEQYVNAKVARHLFKQHLKTKSSCYPCIPQIEYNADDATKYHSSVLQLNRLRTAIGQHRLSETIRAIGAIICKYPQILIPYIKGGCFKSFLTLAEYLSPSLKHKTADYQQSSRNL